MRGSPRELPPPRRKVRVPSPGLGSFHVRGGDPPGSEGYSVQSQHNCRSLLPLAVSPVQSHTVAPPLLLDVSLASSPCTGVCSH